MKPYKHLLIDGRNCVYRAVYAVRSDPYSKEDCFVTFVKFIHSYYDLFKPKRVHIMWDYSGRIDDVKGEEGERVWRKEIFPEYKQDRKTDLEILSEVTRVETLAHTMMNHMGIRQYMVDSMEADDLIYAFCKLVYRDNIMVISSDSDLKQLIYRYKNIDLYNPLKKEMVEVPSLDPVKVKSLTGDKADNIDGYYKIGPVRSRMLIEEDKLEEFFKSDKAINKDGDKVGRDLYERNLKLIDLAKCPEIDKNVEYISDTLNEPMGFEKYQVEKFIRKHKLLGLMRKFTRYISPFKELYQK